MTTKAVKYTKRESLDKRKTTSKASKTIGSSVYRSSNTGNYTACKTSEMTDKERIERRKALTIKAFNTAYESHHKKR